jgi:amidophosphoribosyltransferase
MVKAREACGLFGVFGDPKAVELTYYGLFSLQHRGQESAGIASLTKDQQIQCVRGMGKVAEVFKGHDLEKLSSHAAIGHVRYSTTGESHAENAQPLLVRYQRGQVALGHNGNLTNNRRLRASLVDEGSIFATTTDSEVVLHLLARHSHQKSFDAALNATLSELIGAFSLVLLWPDRMIAVRDPWGIRPLWYGQKDGAHIFGSETAPFDIIGAEALKEVEPGTWIEVSASGVREERYAEAGKTAHCLFEHIYFARPDSQLFGDLSQAVRRKAGAKLALEHPVEADLVCPIPDSGNEAAIGYAQASGIPLGTAFVRNHYVGRTFIQPSAKDRIASADIKLNVVKAEVAGRRIVIVDDSIVRGTTSKKRIHRLREAGAKEIHFRVSCPPIISPCHYGLDFQSRGELIGASKTVAEIEAYLELDSLGFLSLEGLLSSVSKTPDSYCTACWTGNYPLPTEEV